MWQVFIIGSQRILINQCMHFIFISKKVINIVDHQLLYKYSIELI